MGQLSHSAGETPLCAGVPHVMVCDNMERSVDYVRGRAFGSSNCQAIGVIPTSRFMERVGAFWADYDSNLPIFERLGAHGPFLRVVFEPGD